MNQTISTYRFLAIAILSCSVLQCSDRGVDPKIEGPTVQRLVWTLSNHFQSITKTPVALAYSDSGWFVLCDTVGNVRTRRWLYRINPSTHTFTSVSFSNSQAMDVVDADLWLAGKYFVERWGFPQLTIRAHYDLSSDLFSRNVTAIRGLAVSDAIIYLIGLHFDSTPISASLFRFDTTGQFIDVRPIDSATEDLLVVNGRIWCTNNSGYFYELDPNTLQVKTTYYLVQENVCRFQGIAVRNGQLGLADFLQNYLIIFDAPLPQ